MHRIHHIWLRELGGYMMLSVEDFTHLDQDYRAHMIVEGRVEFLDADGMKVPLEEALSDRRSYSSTRPMARVPEDSGVFVAPARTSHVAPAGARRRGMVVPIRLYDIWSSEEQVGLTERIGADGLSLRSRRSYSAGSRVIMVWRAGSPHDERWTRGTVVRSGHATRADGLSFPFHLTLAFDTPSALSA